MHRQTSASLILALSLATGIASASDADNPDWKESETPQAPAFDVKRLVAFDVSVNASLNFGIDPATLQIGRDGVVRYVVVASNSSGAMNAMYEGIRCSTAEFKTYARFHGNEGWSNVASPQWQSLYDTAASRHTLRLAVQGVCAGKAQADSVSNIVSGLKAGNNWTTK